MYSRLTSAIGAMVLLPTVASAAAGPKADGFSVAVIGGANLPLTGDVHGGVSAPVDNLGVLNPALEGTPATLNIGRRTYHDVYANSGILVGLELSYAYTDSLESYARVFFDREHGGTLNVGVATVPSLKASLPIDASFGDRKAISAVLGGRYWFVPGGRVRPFVGANFGATHLDSVSATFTVPAADITLNNVRFFKASNVLAAAVEAGAGWQVADGLELDLTLAANYSGGPKADPTDLEPLGLGSINRVQARWSKPVTVSARYRF